MLLYLVLLLLLPLLLTPPLLLLLLLLLAQLVLPSPQPLHHTAAVAQVQTAFANNPSPTACRKLLPSSCYCLRGTAAEASPAAAPSYSNSCC
jgi:hypothetical protein